MKKIKLNFDSKKLTLNKVTISKLDAKKIKGGKDIDPRDLTLTCGINCGL